MEVPWPNILALANALTGTPWIYFVFYMYLTLDLSCFRISLLMAYLYFVRLVATNVVIYFIEKRRRYARLFLTCWCAGSALACVLLFTWTAKLAPATTTSAVWSPMLLVLLTLFGCTYLSLGVLVETAILKSWGDYRIYFYGHHRPWLEWTLLCLTIVTGGACFMMDAAPASLFAPSTLLYLLFCSTIVLGVGIMCFIVVFKSHSIPSGPTSSLGLTPSSPWIKSAWMQPSDFMLLPSNFAPYKPYSLFGEPLSHISEEDASMLQRMQSYSLMREASTATGTTAASYLSSSILPAPSLLHSLHPSYGATSQASNNDEMASITGLPLPPPYHHRRYSNTSFSYDLNTSPTVHMDSPSASPLLRPTNTAIQQPPPLLASSAASSFLHHAHPHPLAMQPSQQPQQSQQTSVANGSHSNAGYLSLMETPVDAPVAAAAGWESVSSYELALFSFVPPDMPAIALLPFLLVKGDDGVIDSPGLWTLINPPPVDAMQLHLLQLNTLLLGIISAFMQTFLFVYFYRVLQLPMVIVGLAGSCMIMAELLLLKTIPKWIHGIHVTRMTLFIHVVLIICSFGYIFLQPHSVTTMVAALLLPFFQSGVFNMAWLVASNRINSLVWSDHHRIFQRSVMSALYSCVGPMIGVTLAGYMISEDETMASFAQVYQTAIGFLVFSFILSWGWSDSD
ncbi:hypothetical protein BC940DRAFT_274473 [Gongronella butleri]|nr:hypothetical protein BC940DRAFT_274473 [Gongronella butleri]